MLFSSYTFLFGFLPLCLIGFYLARRTMGNEAGLVFLTAASFVFYSWSGLFDLALLGVSICLNYLLALALGRLSRTPAGRRVLAAGIAINLLNIGFFKYLGFVQSMFGVISDTPSHLPLGISFYTFVQITYLVDVFRGARVEKN